MFVLLQIDMVNQGSPLARESAAGCIWSMSVVNINIKELVTRCGATGPLVELLISGSPTAREEVGANKLRAPALNPNPKN